MHDLNLLNQLQLMIFVNNELFKTVQIPVLTVLLGVLGFLSSVILSAAIAAGTEPKKKGVE